MNIILNLTHDEATEIAEERRRVINSFEAATWEWMDSYAQSATAIYRKHLCFNRTGDFDQTTRDAVLKQFDTAIGLWLTENKRPKLGELPSILPKI